MTSTIELPSGHIVLLDDEDWDWIASFNWCVYNVKDKVQYAARTQKLDHKRTTIAMHNQIMNHTASYFIIVDHKNNNGLDNRRCNLEIVTQSINIRRGYDRRIKRG
jgi:hypothetical protein